MKIFTGDQISQADRYTIEHEPIRSINLMERAAEVISQWICNNIPQETPLVFFIGKGGNGGDGLAVARILYNVGFDCTVCLIADKTVMSEDCRYNLGRLPRGLSVKILDDLVIAENTVIIDALLGSGLKGTVKEPVKGAIESINALGCRVISIDLPSGMFTEGSSAENVVVHAETTLAIQFPKLSMLLPDSGEAAGRVVVLNIGLSEDYLYQMPSAYYYVDADLAAKIVKPRAKFAHKGTYGHALLICGSEGMTGAAVLATGAALRSGCGIVTTHVPVNERSVIHTTNPSAIVDCDPERVFSQLPANIEPYSAIGVGCGIGGAQVTVSALEELLNLGKQLVIDADAINIIAANPKMIPMLPAGSVLTPHIGELRRMIGEWSDDTLRNEKVAAFAKRTSCIVVVKGAHTMICLPDGRCYFNSTGSSAMAKGGSGDVLAGYITGLIARGYTAEEAAILGVYVHGAAGDKAAEYFGAEGMNSGDIIDFLGETMAEIK